LPLIAGLQVDGTDRRAGDPQPVQDFPVVDLQFLPQLLLCPLVFLEKACYPLGLWLQLGAQAGYALDSPSGPVYGLSVYEIYSLRQAADQGLPDRPPAPLILPVQLRTYVRLWGRLQPFLRQRLADLAIALLFLLSSSRRAIACPAWSPSPVRSPRRSSTRP
jgi:hypothetical protein